MTDKRICICNYDIFSIFRAVDSEVKDFSHYGLLTLVVNTLHFRFSSFVGINPFHLDKSSVETVVGLQYPEKRVSQEVLWGQT